MLGCFAIFALCQPALCRVERRGSGYACSATPSLLQPPPSLQIWKPPLPPSSFSSLQIWAGPPFIQIIIRSSNILKSFSSSSQDPRIAPQIWFNWRGELSPDEGPLLVTSLAKCSSTAPPAARAVRIDRITLGHIRPPGGQNKVH